MGIYQDRVLPRITNAVMNRRDLLPIRDRVCAGLDGEVLEIGFGSGLDVPHYPPAVTRVRARGRGCHLNRPIDRLLVGSGLEPAGLETCYVEGPKSFGYMFEGRAIKA